MFEWQKVLWNTLSGKPDDRKIIWFWDSEGGKGKTTMAKEICLEYPNEAVYVCGRGSDMKFAIANMIKDGKGVKIVIIDVSRSGDLDYVGLEEIKNGIFFSTKYEAGMVIYETPHVVVFSNFPPETQKLSDDRWDIRKLE